MVSSGSVVDPLTRRCLDAQVSARLGEREFDPLLADVQGDDVFGLDGGAGTEKDSRIALSVGAVNKDDMTKLHSGLIVSTQAMAPTTSTCSRPTRRSLVSSPPA